ncbi:NAD(P)-binding domain-containing protein [Bordetella sp. FB-8]|uniref:NAD(P)-binding domain-containing protein n=1 Tax=Bordetella sp. FB-8 TaxID=1159870 RepID=UPI0003A7D276|nr:NAD(P)-binding domain-containing protein [Bordetella sp. FB-8]
MKVTVVGTGNMGSAFVKQLTKAGHEVRVTGRNAAKAQALDDGPAFADGQRGSVFFAGDSDAAKSTVKSLIDSLGFRAVDAGGLRNARYLEPLAGLNIYFGYGAGVGTSIAPSWIAK